MAKNNDIYYEMDQIIRRIREMEEEYGIGSVAPKGRIVPTPKPMPPEIKKEYERLIKKLDELKRQEQP